MQQKKRLGSVKGTKALKRRKLEVKLPVETTCSESLSPTDEQVVVEVEESETTKSPLETSPSNVSKEVASDDQSAALETKISSAPGFFSSVKFDSLDLCDPLKKAISEMKLTVLTEIQAKTMPLLLKGNDVLGAARTGSGKTLAFLVPAAQLLYQIKFLPRNGCGCLVISPTRELAIQIYDVARQLCQFVPQTTGIVIGGAKRKTEVDKLSKGVNILIATPGRLLDHLQNTPMFCYKNLIMLVIDEADRILEIGFEEDMTAIIKRLPKRRQTALFSATQTTKVDDLARLSLKRPVLVEVKARFATVDGLQQGYAVCPADKRFQLLFTFLKKNVNKKIMVFFSTCMSVTFHDDLLSYIDFQTMSIHGKKKQAVRMSTYYEFCEAESGILLCTDVAARGLDIPKVDWIIQYDPPDDPREYIHRVGRTARGADGQGKALLFLMPEELMFLQYLKDAGVPLSEYSFAAKKIAAIEEPFRRIIRCNHHLHRLANDAYRSYMHAYASHSLKEIFDVHSLDPQKACSAFGLEVAPKVLFDGKSQPINKQHKKKKIQQHYKR